MHRAPRPPLPLLLALALLTACGGSGPGPGDGPVDPAYRIEPPHDPAHVAIAVRPDGEVEVLKGLTEEDRAAGRRFPSRETSGYSARYARIQADASQPWLQVVKALERVTSRGDTNVDLDIHGAVGAAHSVTILTGPRPRKSQPDRQRLVLAFGFESGMLHLRTECSDGKWLREHGCEAARGPEWPWDGGRALGPLQAYVLQLRELCPATLDVRVEVPGHYWPASTRPGGEAEPTRPTVAEVADLLDMLGRSGVAFVDLALGSWGHPHRTPGVVERGLDWLAAHQAHDGRWDADAFLTWCHRKPMRAEDPGDGAPGFDVGATASALLAFLGAGYGHRGSHPHAHTVSEGIRWLCSQQRPDGTLGDVRQPLGAQAHGLGTAALAHVVALTNVPTWKGRAALALDVLPEVWRGAPGDAEVTSAALLAVNAAQHAVEAAEGRNRPRPWTLDASFLDALHAACRTWTSGPTHLEAATGIAGCLILGDDPADAWKRTVAAAAADLDTLDPRALYAYYLCAFRMRGDTFKAWNLPWSLQVKEHAPARRDGRACCLYGSWTAPQGLSLPGGLVETTAAYLMTSEIHYRYDKVLR